MRPNFTGTWRLNAAKSRMPKGSASRMSVRIEHVDPLLTQIVEVSRADGSTDTQTFDFRSDGQEVVQSAGTLRTSARWNGEELVIESHLKSQGKEFYFKDHWTLSADGKMLTMTHKYDVLDGQTAVLERAE